MKGQTKGMGHLVYLCAPLANQDLAEKQVSQVVSKVWKEGKQLVGIQLLRLGINQFQFQPLVFLSEGGKQEENDQKRVLQFLDDCVCLNPAQYNWFESSELPMSDRI